MHLTKILALEICVQTGHRRGVYTQSNFRLCLDGDWFLGNFQESSPQKYRVSIRRSGYNANIRGTFARINFGSKYKVTVSWGSYKSAIFFAKRRLRSRKFIDRVRIVRDRVTAPDRLSWFFVRKARLITPETSRIIDFRFNNELRFVQIFSESVRPPLLQLAGLSLGGAEFVEALQPILGGKARSPRPILGSVLVRSAQPSRVCAHFAE